MKTSAHRKIWLKGPFSLSTLYRHMNNVHKCGAEELRDSRDEVKVEKFEGDGRCVICDSYVRPCSLVRICDECNYGSYQGRCVICGGPGVSEAYYCKECTIMEKDRDGCPKIVNLGSAKTDLFYERKKFGHKKN